MTSGELERGKWDGSRDSPGLWGISESCHVPPGGPVRQGSTKPGISDVAGFRRQAGYVDVNVEV